MNDLKSKLQPIRAAIDAALAGIAKQHGLRSLTCGKCGYDPRAGNFTIKVEGVDGEGITSEGARYNLLRDQFRGDDGEKFKLPPLDTEFLARDGQTYKVVGLNMTGSKVLCFRVGSTDSGTFLFKPEAVQRLCAPRAPGLQKRGVKVTSELVRKLGERS